MSVSRSRKLRFLDEFDKIVVTDDFRNLLVIHGVVRNNHTTDYLKEKVHWTTEENRQIFIHMNRFILKKLNNFLSNEMHLLLRSILIAID